MIATAPSSRAVALLLMIAVRCALEQHGTARESGVRLRMLTPWRRGGARLLPGVLQVVTIAAGVGSTVKVSPLAPGVGELAPVDGH
jgi:hypothetical protein